MRELKLRYFIDLASNIGRRAREDAQALDQAQKIIQGAITGTNGRLTNWNTLTAQATGSTRQLQEVLTGATNKFAALDRVMTRAGTNTSMERQVGYMRRLAASIDQTQGRATRLAQTLATGLGKVPGAVASTAAAGYIVGSALKTPVDYDTRLRGVTGTAFAGKSIEELRSGRKAINDLVVDTVRRAPGASRDQTLEAFEKLVGTGSFSYDESSALLPTIMRTAVASRSEANDLVQAAEKMKVNLGLTPKQIEVGLAKVMRAGQEGGFEIKDAAKWIGPLMPFMKGYKGMAGVEQLVTMLQQVRSTAGTNDEAANNLKNFLQKIGADSTRKDFKKQGFDLDAEMARGVLAQQTPVETYMALLDRVMAKNDPDGKARAMMAKADKAATPEQRDAQYEEIKRIYENSAVSKIINDLQEFGGYEGLRRTREYGKKVLAAVQSENGNAVATGFQFMSEGTGAKAQLAANNKDIAATDALESASGPLNKLLDGANSLAERFPTLAASAWSASVALSALSASSILNSVLAAKVLKDVGRGTTVAGGTAAAGASGGAATAAAAASGASRMATAGKVASRVLKFGGPLALLGGGIDAVGVLADEKADKPRELTRVGVTTGGALGGAAAGAALGSVVPGLGTAFGGIVGGLLGGFGGGAATGALFDSIWAKKDPAARQAALPQAPLGKGFVSGLAVPQLDLLTLTAPGMGASSPLAAGKTTEVKVGEGRLAIDVRVSDDRVLAVPSIIQQPSLVKINAGGTNPGGFQ